MKVPVEEELRLVEIERIKTNPFQPRRQFAKEELEELAASIKSVGIIHPPVVRPLYGSDDEYELLAGERRVRASELAGLKAINVLVKNFSNLYSAEAALIENIQRVDLNPLEIAKALKSLAEDFRWTQEEISEKVGKKRSTIANYFRLLTLPSEIKESLSNGAISMGHAKAILSMQYEKEQLALHDRVLKENLSVRQTEALVLKKNKVERSEGFIDPQRDFFLEAIANKIEGRLGTKVVVTSGKVIIDYYHLDDLDRILAFFKIEE
ncbi:putative chromosome partitioning protein [Chlamydiales bacterium STE3]|nr:putative chromosome partitioning protein [Chlamydiales bacterium STE3]